MDSDLRALESFPEDMLRQVFSRLPARTLLQFRSVSRSLRALIDDRNFAGLHLSSFSNNIDESRLFIVQERTLYTSYCVVVGTESFGAPDWPLIQRSRGPVQDWQVVGSVDGLFMVRQTAATRRIMLWNPSTQRTLPLPASPVLPGALQYDDFGLGFDPVSQDYRHVRFVQDFEHLAVYSLATDSWRTIGFGQWPSSLETRCWIPEWQKSLCFRGVLYVLATTDTTDELCLVSFDLATDECLIWYVPFDAHLIENFDAHPVANYYDQVLTTADGGSSLAFFNFSRTHGTMWVLEGADLHSGIWVQHYAFPMQIFVVGDFWYLTRNDEIVLRRFGGITCYNLATGQERILLMGHFNRGKAWQYKENLIWF